MLTTNLSIIKEIICYLPINIKEGDPDTNLWKEDDKGCYSCRLSSTEVPDFKDVTGEEHYAVEHRGEDPGEEFAWLLLHNGSVS